MARFIERFKARHKTDGKPQMNDFVANPHNSDLDGNGQKDMADIPASDTAKEPVQNTYKKELNKTAKRGRI